MRVNNVPLTLQAEIREFYSYIWAKAKRSSNLDSLLKDLNQDLSHKLKSYLNMSTFRRSQLFSPLAADVRFVDEFRSRLFPIHLGRHDKVVTEGQLGTDMYHPHPTPRHPNPNPTQQAF